MAPLSIYRKADLPWLGTKESNTLLRRRILHRDQLTIDIEHGTTFFDFVQANVFWSCAGLDPDGVIQKQSVGFTADGDQGHGVFAVLRDAFEHKIPCRQRI